MSSRSSPTTVVQYCPLLSTMVQYCPLLSTTVVQYCPLWPTTVNYCPLWSNTVQYYPLLSTSLHYYPLLSTTIQYCSLLSTTVHQCSLLSTTVHQCSLLSTFLEPSLSSSSPLRNFPFFALHYIIPPICAFSQFTEINIILVSNGFPSFTCFTILYIFLPCFSHVVNVFLRFYEKS